MCYNKLKEQKMYREAIRVLEKWKANPGRKPLVVKGARQVGKTWLVQKFAETAYENSVYVNFDRDQDAKSIFELDYDPERIISQLSAHARKDIIKEKTLIFLDEIQECPRALEALKYFTEEAPEYHIIVAGSLLGVFLNAGFSFPVGKVEFLDIFPLSFNEFLLALGEDRLVEAIKFRDYQSIVSFHDRLINYYKNYLVTGGMPAVVQDYLNTKSFLSVRDAQNEILESYIRDFNKHAPANEVPRIIEIFNTIPSVLAKENKKFMFGAIKESARAREYEAALLWLVNAGIVSKIPRVNKIALPLSAYADHNIFKLFYVDVGLLGSKAGIRPEVILEDNAFFEEFKGALAEQFVFQELKAANISPFYYSKDDSRAELDFLVDTAEGPTPIEVKAGKSLSSKSLTLLMQDNPDLQRAYKISTLPYQENERITNLPAYLTGAACGGVWWILALLPSLLNNLRSKTIILESSKMSLLVSGVLAFELGSKKKVLLLCKKCAIISNERGRLEKRPSWMPALTG